MAAGHCFTQYRGHNFLTVVEARWAVFFDGLPTGEVWHYDHEAGWGLANTRHYRPQFFLPRLGAYLEVQRPDDHQSRQPLRHYDPEIEEPIVYLAVGDLPDERQLRLAGWWDPDSGQGVRNLTQGFEWEAWFPPDSDGVLRAIEVARTTEFVSAIPLLRQPGEEITDIPERDREQRPE